MHISRRVLLGGGVAGAGLVLVSGQAAAADSRRPEPPPGQITVRDSKQLSWLGGDLATSVTLAAPTALRLRWPRGWGSRIQFEVVADPRLMEFGTFAAIAYREGGSRIPVVQDRAGHIGFVVDAPSTTTAFDVLLAWRGLRPFPADAFDDAQAFQAIATDASDPRRRLSLRIDPSTPVPAEAWGVQVFAAYGGDRTRVPARVSIRSTGPKHTPEGSLIAVTTDARVLDSLGVAAAILATREAGPLVSDIQRLGNELVIATQLPSIGPGDTLELTYESSVGSGFGKLLDPIRNQAYFSPHPDGRYQRDTGKSSSTDEWRQSAVRAESAMQVSDDA